MSVEAAPVQPGDVLAGKYRVDRVIGSGGMGVVVAATHIDLGQRVALKFLLPAALANPEVAARFLREARAAVKIQSEHVARVLDVGRLESGVPYMVMEYLDGHDLSDHPRGLALPIASAVELVLQACEAMAVAHSCGIVHRDLKPANLFLTMRPDGSPSIKVLDFGISKVTEMEGEGKALTQTSSIMGSPLYMSPEQMRSSRNVDARTDVWSLGAILYELVAGVTPFDGETIGEVFAAVIGGEPEPLRSRRPDAPPALERAVHRALTKDPAQRFQNVGELAMALGEFAPAARASVDRASGVLSRAGFAMAAPPPSALAPAVAPRSSAIPVPPPADSAAVVERTAMSPSTPPGARTASAWAETGSGTRPGGGARLVIGGVLALCAVIGVALGIFFARRGPAAQETAGIAAAAVPAPTPIPAVPAPAPLPAVPAAPVSAAPAPAPAPSAPAAPAPAPHTAARPPRPTPAPTAAPAPARAPQPRTKSSLSIDFK